MDIHELSDKNPDYFFCTLHYKTLNVRTVTRKYADLDDLQSNLVDSLNDQFGSKDLVIRWNRENKYVKLVCKYKGCVSQHWFKYNLNYLDQPVNLTMFRNINFNHCLAAHSNPKNIRESLL